MRSRKMKMKNAREKYKALNILVLRGINKTLIIYTNNSSTLNLD